MTTPVVTGSSSSSSMSTTFMKPEEAELERVGGIFHSKFLNRFSRWHQAQSQWEEEKWKVHAIDLSEVRRRSKQYRPPHLKPTINQETR